ncbi:hypothetical protein AVEN_113703-1, partial [Araneus ventricosus]
NQSLESDVDAEMSSSSASEGDTAEYDMSGSPITNPNCLSHNLPPPLTVQR